MKDQLETLKSLGVKTLQVTGNEAVAVNPYDEQAFIYFDKFQAINALPPLPTSGIPDGQVGIEEVEPVEQYRTVLIGDTKTEWYDYDGSPKIGNYDYRIALRLKEQGEEKPECTHEPLTDTGVGYHYCPACEKSWSAPVEPQPEKIREPENPNSYTKLELSRWDNNDYYQPEKPEQTAEGILNTYHPIKHDIQLRTDLWPTSTVLDAMQEYASQCLSKHKSKLLAEIPNILDGIDAAENDYEEGWWETSTGAKFGKSKLEEIIKLITNGK